MKWKGAVLVVALLVTAGVLNAPSQPAEVMFSNQYLSMKILRDWSVRSSSDQRLIVVKDKYLLTINPVFSHASGVEGGRFSEIVQGMPSVDAVMRNVDQPAGGAECALSPSDALTVSEAITLGNLYTDSAKTENGCVFPAHGSPVWFGSFLSGNGPESEYTITLSSNTSDVNELPRKGSAQLEQAFTEVVAMLKTMQLKPPIVISKISPPSASPGETVTIYGSGFSTFDSKAHVMLLGVTDDLNAVVAEDGKSLVFEVPTSVLTVSCQEGRILIGGFCLPIPPGHVDVNDCPRKSDDSSNFCGIPISPGPYQILITAGGASADPLPFSVTAPQLRSISISLMYPVSFVSAGNLIIVRGSGFVANGNSVRIGEAVVTDLPSADGKTILFRAPQPTGKSLMPGTETFKAVIVNANGESNSISFAYR